MNALYVVSDPKAGFTVGYAQWKYYFHKNFRIVMQSTLFSDMMPYVKGDGGPHQ
jgi:hypothetical protein